MNAYEPPFDSPIEDIFAWQIIKYLGEDVVLEKQVEVPTICGLFRLDFAAVMQSGARIGFECDGFEFHDDPVRDECRDDCIMGSGGAIAIYRIRGTDIVNHIDDVLFAISTRDPEIFSPRGIANLRQLASPTAKPWADHADPWLRIHYPREVNDHPAHLRYLWLERRTYRVKKHAPNFFPFAESVRGGRLEDVIAQWTAKIKKEDDQ